MKLKKFDVALILAMFIALAFTSFEVNSFTQTKDKLIRFHVLANSNSSIDQELKLQVKDVVFEYISSITSDANDKYSANDIIAENLDNINVLAHKTITDLGFDYSTTTTLDLDYYPYKSYENFALPAGYYYGVNISIGDALGENWWCVLYPPLCNQTAFDTKNLTDSELALIGGTDYEFRFKFLDIYSSVLAKINRA